MDKNNGQKNSKVDRKFVCRLGSIYREYSNSNIEVNIMRWNNGRNKLDIRLWAPDGVIPLKGMALTRQEYFWLINTLCRVNPVLIANEPKKNNRPLPEQIEEAEAAQQKIEKYAENILPPGQNAEEYCFISEGMKAGDDVEFIDETDGPESQGEICEDMPDDETCDSETCDSETDNSEECVFEEINEVNFVAEPINKSAAS